MQTHTERYTLHIYTINIQIYKYENTNTVKSTGLRDWRVFVVVGIRRRNRYICAMACVIYLWIMDSVIDVDLRVYYLCMCVICAFQVQHVFVTEFVYAIRCGCGWEHWLYAAAVNSDHSVNEWTTLSRRSTSVFNWSVSNDTTFWSGRREAHDRCAATALRGDNSVGMMSTWIQL